MANAWDLIPDFIPILGYLDDLILVPLGILLVIRLTPKEVRVAASRTAIRNHATGNRRGGVIAAAVIVVLWIAVLALVVRVVVRMKR